MSKISTQMNDDLLVKYLLDEADGTERVRVEEWLEKSEANLNYFEQFRLILDQSRLPGAAIDEYEALERLHGRMKQAEQRDVPFSRRKYGWLKVAATIAVFLTLGWWAYVTYLGEVKTVNVLAGSEVLTDTLPDGSMATLNRNSSISYPGRFRGGTREIKLSGEAFFDVQPDKSRPFVISTDNVKITVVGTSFNVRNRDGETIVTVETGIVRVNKGYTKVELRAGEQVKVSEGESKLLKERNSDKLYRYYYSNELVCHNTPLYELVDILNEKFDARIIIGNSSLRHLPISVTFRNESLEEILDVVAETLNIRVERKGGEIILK